MLFLIFLISWQRRLICTGCSVKSYLGFVYNRVIPKRKSLLIEGLFLKLFESEAYKSWEKFRKLSIVLCNNLGIDSSQFAFANNRVHLKEFSFVVIGFKNWLSRKSWQRLEIRNSFWSFGYWISVSFQGSKSQFSKWTSYGGGLVFKWAKNLPESNFEGTWPKFHRNTMRMPLAGQS